MNSDMEHDLQLVYKCVFVDTSIFSVDFYLINWAPIQLMPPCDACMRPLSNKSSINSSFPSLDCTYVCSAHDLVSNLKREKITTMKL